MGPARLGWTRPLGWMEGCMALPLCLWDEQEPRELLGERGGGVTGVRCCLRNQNQLGFLASETGPQAQALNSSRRFPAY